MSNLSSPSGSSGASCWNLVSASVPTGIISNKRDGSNLDGELFNIALIQRRKLNHANLSIFTMPWDKPNIINDTLKKLMSTPIAIVPMPVIKPDPVTSVQSMAVRPQYTYASSVMSKLSWAEQDDLDRHKALLRWRRIIESDISMSQTGSALEQLITDHVHDADIDIESRVTSMFNDTFARKSTATLIKRSCDLLKYMDWCKLQGEDRPLLLSEQVVYDYVSHLKSSGAGPSCANSFISSLRFALRTIGLKYVQRALSQRVIGSGQLQLQTRGGIIKQARPLTVKQVYLLEQTSIEHEDLPTKYIAGYLCYCLYACCRFRDPMFAFQWTLDAPSDAFGYLETRSNRRKTSNTIKKSVFLPMVAFTHGFYSTSWATKWFDVRESVMADIDDGFGNVFVLPALLRNGNWANRPMSTSEGSKALREILRSNGEDVTGISTHSLKVTMLSWASKANMSVDDRRILGHHIDPHMVSALTYSRDAMSGPLERLWKVIQSIKNGEFLPDESRARRTGRALGLISNDVQDTLTADELLPEAPDQVEDEIVSQSSSDDSDVLSDISPEEEHSALNNIAVGGRVLFDNEPNVFVHKDSGLGHLMHDEEGLRFVCGKMLSPAYRTASSVSYQVHMCLRCKPRE